MPSLTEIMVSIRVDDSELGKLDAAGQKIDAMGQQGESVGRSMQTVGLGMAAVGAAGTAAFGVATSKAIDFEAAISGIASVGGADAVAAMDQIRESALDLGASTSFSASEAAGAMEELIKAGVPVQDVLAGAAQSALDLSAATGVATDAAAGYIAQGLNVFNDTLAESYGTVGERAEHVANVLAQAANASATDVGQLGYAMSAAGNTAAMFGLSIDDTATALALLAQNGLQGSDAGTSLKSMFLSLTNASKPTKEALGQLGLSLDDFYDSAGNFKGIEANFDMLRSAMMDAGYTSQEVNSTLAQIFGSDAVRAASVFFKTNEDGWDGMRDGMENAGTVQEQAAIRLNNLKGALDAMSGSIETAGIVIGTALIPAIRLGAETITMLVNGFLALPEPIQSAVAIVGGLVSVLATGLGGAMLVVPKVLEFGKALQTLSVGARLASVAFGPLGIALAAIGIAVVAYKENWLGFGDAVDSVVAKVTTFASQFGQIFDLFRNGSDAASGLTQTLDGFGKAVEFTTGLPVAGFFSKLASVLDEIGGHFASVGDRVQELMGAGFTPLEAAVRALREEFPAFSGAIAAVGTVFQNLIDTAQGVGEGLLHAFDALRSGDLGGIFQGLLEASGAAIGGLVENWRLIGTYLIQAFQAINWGEVSATLQTGLQNASSAFQQWFGTISQNLITWFQSIDWDAVGGMLSTGLQTAISAMGDVASLLLTKGSELITGLSAGFAQAWPTVSAWLGTVPTLIGAAISGAGSLAEILITKGVELIGGLAAGFAQKWPEISAWLSQVPTLIGAAITAAGDVGILLLQKGVDLIGGLLAGFIQKWPDISSWLGNLAGLIGTAVTISTDLLLQKGIDLLTGLKSGIDQKWPEVEAWLGTVTDLVGAAVGDLTQTLLAKGSDLLAGLKSGIDQKWAEVDAWLAAMPQDIADTVGDLAATLQTKGSDLLAGLKAGIDQKWTEIDSWLAALPQDISDTVGDLTQTLSDKGTALIQGLSTGAQDFWTGTVEPWLTSVAGLASTAVGDLSQAILARGTELITGLSSGAQDFWTGTVEPWLGTVSDLASTAVGDLTQTLVEKGTALIDGLRHGAQDLWNNTLAPWIQSLPGLIVSAVGDLSQTLVAKGEEVINGFLQGLKNAWAGVTSWISSLSISWPTFSGPSLPTLPWQQGGEAQGQAYVDGAVNTVNAGVPAAEQAGGNLAGGVLGGAAAVGGIHSPSTEMIKLAEFMVEGWIIGLKNRTPDAISAARDIATGTMEAIRAEISASVSIGASIPGDLAQGIDRAKPEAVAVAKDLGDSIAQTVQSRLEAIFDLVGLGSSKVKEGGKRAGRDIGDSVNEGVESKKADHQKKMGDFLDAGVSYGLNKADDATDIGVKAAEALNGGLESGIPDAVVAAGKLATQVVKEVGDRLQQMYDVGVNYADGFIRGMQSMADEAAAAANDLGKSAEKELRKATESASPSKAAHRVGADVGKGFAEGIASGEEMTKKAARQLWRAAWKELKDNIKEGGFLGRDWAVEFWEGMLGAPDMTGPLAQWITDQMVEAADTALKKIQAKLAGIAAQLDIARNYDPANDTVRFPEVEQPAAVDTSERDMYQKQLDATKELTDTIEKAFTQAFSAAHKAHIDFVQGTISESEYLAKYQAAQDAFNAKNANARQAEALEAQVKAAQAAIDAETAARQAAYDEAVKARQAAIDAEKERQAQAIKELEQAQRDAQMEMTKAVIDEANQRIVQYQKELSKTNDPQQKAELKAKIALEKERIDVANELAVAIGKANAAGDDMGALAIANAQIQMLIEKLEALGQVDVGGMLQGIADAITAAAQAMADAADKIKGAFGGGGKGGGGKKDKGDKGTQDASDPSLSGGGGMGGGGVVEQIDAVGKAYTKMGNDAQAGVGVADMAIRHHLGTTLPDYIAGMGEAGTKGGKALGDGASVAVEAGTAHMEKVYTKSVESATLNGVKIGHDRGKEVVTEWTGGIEGEATKKTRDVTKTLDGVVTQSTKVAEKSAKDGGSATGDQFIYWTSNAVQKGDREVKQSAKGLMDGAGSEAKRDAKRLGQLAGKDLADGIADGIKAGQKNINQAASDAVKGAHDAAKKKGEIHSPSKLFMRLGHDIGDGLVMGMEDRVGDAREAARALVYTPQGLPGGGSGSPGSGNQVSNRQGGGTRTININGPINLPNVHSPEEFVEWIENTLRTNGVSSGRP